MVSKSVYAPMLSDHAKESENLTNKINSDIISNQLTKLYHLLLNMKAPQKPASKYKVLTYSLTSGHRTLPQSPLAFNQSPQPV